jgi:hypothetical protein
LRQRRESTRVRRSHGADGLHDRRILIALGAFSQTLKSLNLGTLSDVTLTQRPNGSGTITFGPTNCRAAMHAGMPWPGVDQPPAFELVPEAKRVYDIVREAQAAYRVSVA